MKLVLATAASLAVAGAADYTATFNGEVVDGSITFATGTPSGVVVSVALMHPAGVDATMGHSYHLHALGNINMTDCITAGGHYDPTGVEVDGYACDATNTTTCYHGDLSGKFGKIGIGNETSMITYTDTDIDINDLAGRSIVIHAKYGGSPRYACADLVASTVASSTGEAPASSSTGEAPASSSTGEAPASSSTGEAPASSSTGEAPASSSTGEAPASSSTGEAPASSSTGEAPESSTGEQGPIVPLMATFKGLVNGVFRFEPTDMDVHVTFEIAYEEGVNSTSGHKYHLHANGDIDTSDCLTAGGHYDPAGVEVEGYECSRADPTSCYAGDLSGKFDDLRIEAPPSVSGGDFHDPTLDIRDLAGRSIVIHAENGGGPRIACANLVEAAPITPTPEAPISPTPEPLCDGKPCGGGGGGEVSGAVRDVPVLAGAALALLALAL